MRESFYIAGCLVLLAMAIQGCVEAEAKEPHRLRVYQSSRRITGPINTSFAIYRRYSGPVIMATYRQRTTNPAR